jgi:hypothetical protein
VIHEEIHKLLIYVIAFALQVMTISSIKIIPTRSKFDPTPRRFED